MANAPVKIWGKLSQYALQILDFTLNMPHDILGPVAPPTLKDPEYLPRVTGSLVRTHSGASFVINFASLSPASAWPSLA